MGLRVSANSRDAAPVRAAPPPGVATGSGVPASLLLLAAVVLTSLNYSVLKIGLSEIEPLAFCVVRFGLGGLVLLGFLRVREGSVSVRRADLPLLAVTALLGIALQQGSLALALANTTAANVALLGATVPIITALLATMVGFERLGRRHWIAAVAGLAGVALIVRGGIGVTGGSGNALGDALALFNALVSSAAAFPILLLLRRYSPYRILAYEMLIGTALLFPVAIPSLATLGVSHAGPAAWVALAYTIVFSGIAAAVLYFIAMNRVGPSMAAMFQYLGTFLAVVFAVLILGESITVAQLAGGAVVAGSIALSRRPGPTARVWASPGRGLATDPTGIASRDPAGDGGTG